MLIIILSWASFILAMISYVEGARAILRRNARPSVISRFFWLALSITNLLSYFHLNAGSGMFLAAANTLGCILMLLLALKYGYCDFKHADYIATIGASLAFLCFIFISNKWIALTAGLATHFISGIPTYKKVYHHPYLESLGFWLLFALGSGLSLASVILQEKNTIYPLYFLFFDSSMYILLVWRRKKSATLIDVLE